MTVLVIKLAVATELMVCCAMVLGALELVWTCWDAYRENGKLDRAERILLYAAFTVGYMLLIVRPALFEHL